MKKKNAATFVQRCIEEKVFVIPLSMEADFGLIDELMLRDQPEISDAEIKARRDSIRRELEKHAEAINAFLSDLQDREIAYMMEVEKASPADVIQGAFDYTYRRPTTFRAGLAYGAGVPQMDFNLHDRLEPNASAEDAYMIAVSAWTRESDRLRNPETLLSAREAWEMGVEWGRKIVQIWREVYV